MNRPSLSLRFAFLTVVLVSTVGCRHHFRLPYTTGQLTYDSSQWPGEALVHYLSQPNADLSVCTLAPPPALTRTDDELVEPFVDALAENTLEPERWQGCATRLVPALSPAEREVVYARLSRVIVALLDNPEAGPRLIAAHEVLAQRPLGDSPSLEKLMHRLMQWPREKLAPALPPTFDALVATLEMDHGQLAGRALAETDVMATQDESVLGRMSFRLPDAGLRARARAQLIRMRIERSPVAEVKARAAQVEAAVMATGRWAQPASALRLERPTPPMTMPLTVLVRQDVRAQVVTLEAPGQGAEQLVPTLDLKPSLRVAVGWSVPLTLCDAPAAMVVEPCIEARELEVANSTVSLDQEGVLRLPEQLTMAQAVDLARAGDSLVLPVRLGGKLVTTLEVPLRFEAPQPIVFEAATGQHGPAVNVSVQPVASALLFAAVSETGARRQAVYPRNASSHFEVASVGGHGFSGASGRHGIDGARGYNGSSASCPYTPGQDGGRGGDGGPGGSGGPGGPGGEGGLVSVVVQCGGNCADEVALVRRLVRSRGGSGGSGGSGGRGGSGGQGGSGGSGTSCTSNGYSQSLTGGASGARGSDGLRGSDGEDGQAGSDGVVQVQVQ